MDLSDFRDLLARSLEDRHLSRGERQGLIEAFGSIENDETRRAVRQIVFDLARSATIDPATRPVIDWIEAVLDALHKTPKATRTSDANEAHFSPGDTCRRRIVDLFERSERSADVCVFTITDDRISNAVLAARSRGLAIRIITDNEKAEDLGSDIERFEAAGIPVRVDRTSFHMHHKFAIFDGRLLLTGSYNWTRGAADQNEENIIVTPDPGLIGAFSAQFVRLWDRLG